MTRSPFPDYTSCLNAQIALGFRLEDPVSENHRLRLVDLRIDFGFVYRQPKEGNSNAGRPLIDPELLLDILLIGYRYGVSSEYGLIDEPCIDSGLLQKQTPRAGTRVGFALCFVDLEPVSQSGLQGARIASGLRGHFAELA